MPVNRWTRNLDSFKYDPFGRAAFTSPRQAKRASTPTTVNNLIEETNSSGIAVARYSDSLNIDEPLAMLRSSTTSFYDADGLGTITSLANTAGSLAETYTFDSFGNQTASSGSLTNSFQYTAREFDPETSLYYNRARYYDSPTGRLLSEDLFHNYLYKSFYSYVFNSPTNATDPTGKRTRVCCRLVNNIIAGLTLNKYHCSIAIDGNPDINGGGLDTFSLFPANYSTLSDTGIGVPHSDDPSDLGPITNGTAHCTDVPKCGPKCEKKILENQGYGGDAGPSYNYHTIFSYQNSNTYVSYALTKAGCTPPKLPWWLSAPGYSAGKQ